MTAPHAEQDHDADVQAEDAEPEDHEGVTKLDSDSGSDSDHSSIGQDDNNSDLDSQGHLDHDEGDAEVQNDVDDKDLFNLLAIQDRPLPENCQDPIYEGADMTTLQH